MTQGGKIAIKGRGSHKTLNWEIPAELAPTANRTEADTAASGAGGMLPATRMMAGYWQRIPALITFLQQRRKDNSHPVWVWPVIMAVTAAAILLAGISLAFFDQDYLELANEGKLFQSEGLEILTHFGKSKWYLIVSGVIILLLLFVPGQISARFLPAWNRMFFTAWFFFYSISLSGILGLVIKVLTGRTRPRYLESGDALEFTPFRTVYEFNSFPSGHSITAGSLAVILALYFPALRWPLFAFWAFVAATRSLIGVHFPSDVIIGFALGVLVTWIYARSMARHRILFRFMENGTLGLRPVGQANVKNMVAMLKEATIGVSGK